MHRLAYLAALAATVSQPAGSEPVADQTVEPTETILAYERDRYERMTIPVTIGEHGPFRFFVDTGAQATIVTESITDALEIDPVGRATVVAMASRRPADLYHIVGLEFAGRKQPALRSPRLERGHVEADGIIGLDALQDERGDGLRRESHCCRRRETPLLQ